MGGEMVENPEPGKRVREAIELGSCCSMAGEHGAITSACCPMTENRLPQFIALNDEWMFA